VFCISNFSCSKLYLNRLPNDYFFKILHLYVIFDCGKQLNMALCEHITNNQLNFKLVSILNKIEEHFIICIGFAQIFQPKGCGQHGMCRKFVHFQKKLYLVKYYFKCNMMMV
jgi:hypothetical protein